MPTLRGEPAERRRGLAIGTRSKPSKKDIGFKRAAQDIARKQAITYDRAGAILATSTRKTSAAAMRANPNLKKVQPAKNKLGK